MKIYNTMTRKKEEFKPLMGKQVGMYCCGPTVYDYAHIGNLRTYIFEDMLRRALTCAGFKVKHVMNITDVGHLTSDADTGEDKIEIGAKREHKSAWEVAEFYTKNFFSDTEKLNIIRPDITPKATGTIPEQVELIKKIEKNGFTYRTEDGIYFDTSKLKDYGKLTRLKKEDLKAGARIKIVEGKKNPTDFALWKFSPHDQKRQMEWDSPWGIGFPGWHIECSAMSMKYLGETFDIHCGGIDHIPVHHTNEIAQSEAATGKEPVKYWVHGEFLVIGKDKMAKRAGSFTTLQSLIDEGIAPLAYRFFCLTAHYRSQLTFDINAVKSAQLGLLRMTDFMERLGEVKESVTKKDISKVMGKARDDFRKFIEDDLNTPKALAVISDFMREINAVMDRNAIGREDARRIRDMMLDFDRVLGLRLGETGKENAPEEVQKLVSERDKLRKEKKFKESDSLRNKIKELGWEVLDTPKGPKVKKI
jgi:cysteinyl-tRNA synthetase